jgi:hypothetical protein
MTASVGKRPLVDGSIQALKEQMRGSIDRSSDWPESNETPTLHRGQATMLCALPGL